MNRHTELRKLPAGSLTNVSNILEINNDWQRVATIIPKNLQSEQFERKYNNEMIGLIEKHAKKNNRKCAEVLFDEWGTSGRVRPTLDTLIKILQHAQIFRVVDEIAELLGEAQPPRANTLLNNFSQTLDSLKTVDSKDLHNSSRHHHGLCNGTTKPISKELSETNHNVPYISALQSNLSKKNMSYPTESSKTQSENITENIPAITDILGQRHTYELNTIRSLPAESSNTQSSLSYTTNSSIQNYKPKFTPNVNINTYVIDKAILEDKKLVPFEFKELESITDKFFNTLVHKPSGLVGKIGSGGFGDVYVGIHKNYGAMAIKRVRTSKEGCKIETLIKIFNTEVKTLSYLRHENIVPIFGYSIDGPDLCMVCQYIDGGSLQENIATKVLTDECQRMYIIKGTAEGLKFIHHRETAQQSGEVLDEIDLSSGKSYFLHGDVKSANILLTKDCVPKLCDFGLAKQLDETLYTKCMMGTKGYLAPEALNGTVTRKNDIYSFGIVLLELLTGLGSIIKTKTDNTNIKEYVAKRCRDGDIMPLVDRVVRNWRKAQDIYDLAKQCIETSKNDRPSMEQVCIALNDISNKPCNVFDP